MFRKTAITFGLAMIAGTGLAAQSGQDISANTDADISTGGARIGVDTGVSLKSRFDALDSDDNGVISRSDASGNARLQSMFDSLDTGGSIEKDAKSAGAEGISYEQFKAGMQARAQGGVVGDAVSRGVPQIVDEQADNAESSDDPGSMRDEAAGGMVKAGETARNKADEARQPLDDNLKNTADDARTKAKGGLGTAADSATDAAGQQLSSSASGQAGGSLSGDAGSDSRDNDTATGSN